jgi:hypothetical protein
MYKEIWIPGMLVTFRVIRLCHQCALKSEIANCDLCQVAGIVLVVIWREVYQSFHVDLLTCYNQELIPKQSFRRLVKAP